jgi:hypothetical protein
LLLRIIMKYSIECVVSRFQVQQNIACFIIIKLLCCTHLLQLRKPNKNNCFEFFNQCLSDKIPGLPFVHLKLAFEVRRQQTQTIHHIVQVLQVRLKVIICLDVQSQFVHKCYKQLKSEFVFFLAIFEKSLDRQNIRLTDTISAIHLLVLPLSSLIVIGLSSFIRVNAAGQLSLYLRTKSSILLKSLPTSLNAALYCVKRFVHAAVYLKNHINDMLSLNRDHNFNQVYTTR